MYIYIYIYIYIYTDVYTDIIKLLVNLIYNIILILLELYFKTENEIRLTVCKIRYVVYKFTRNYLSILSRIIRLVTYFCKTCKNL